METEAKIRPIAEMPITDATRPIGEDLVSVGNASCEWGPVAKGVGPIAVVASIASFTRR
jgi:hypothetical protein